MVRYIKSLAAGQGDALLAFRDSVTTPVSPILGVYVGDKEMTLARLPVPFDDQDTETEFGAVAPVIVNACVWQVELSAPAFAVAWWLKVIIRRNQFTKSIKTTGWICPLPKRFTKFYTKMPRQNWRLRCWLKR